MRLHVGHGWSLCLLEMGPGTRHEGAEAEIRDREHHVEILVHVTVVKQVVAIQAAEPPRLFHAAGFGQVHAPMDVFVKTVVGGEGDQATEGKGPLAGEICQNGIRCDADEDDHRAIPPSHRDGLLVFLINQMVGFIRFEGAVMDDGVGLESITEFPHRAMHHILVEGPLEK